MPYYMWMQQYLKSGPSILGSYAAILGFRMKYVYPLYRAGDEVDRDAIISDLIESLKLTIPKFTGRPLEALDTAESVAEDLLSEIGGMDSLEEAKLLLEEIEVEYLEDFNRPLRKYGLRLSRSLEAEEADALLKLLDAIERRRIVRDMTAAGSSIVYIQGLSLDAFIVSGIGATDFEEIFSCMVLVRTDEDASIPAYFLSREFRRLLEEKAKQVRLHA